MLGPGESDLLAALHGGAFDQPLWSRFLAMLRDDTGAACALLYLRPAEGPLVQLAAGPDLPPAFHQALVAALDDGAGPRRRMREGRVYARDELADIIDVADGRGALAAALDAASLTDLRIVRVGEAGGTDACAVILRDRPFAAAAGALLSRVAPHLHIALCNFVALERERTRSSISSEMMGRLNFAWLTVDSHCRIVDQSPGAEAIFRRTHVVRRGRYNRLTFATPRIDTDVAALVRAYADGVETRPRAFRLSQDPWMDIFVMPGQDRLASPGSSAAALIYLSGDRWSREDRCDQLTDLFGLLPSEARLAWAIAQGRSIAEAAGDLGLTIETARNYSKKIYSKTGASGQAELVRIIFTSLLAVM